MAALVRINHKKAQSLIETALILPIVVLMLTGIIDFGLVFNHYMVISNASREGTRSAAIGTSDMDIRSEIAAMTASLNQSKIKITILPTESLRKKGDEVSVQVEYDNQLLTPVIAALVPNPVHINAKTVMRIE